MAVKYDLFKEARIDLIEGIFELLEVYTHAYEWLKWRHYVVNEKKYKETLRAKGREIKIEWACTRDIDEYTRFEIDVRWHVIGVNDIAVEQGNRKVKLQKGEIVIFVSAIIVYDYDDQWEGSVFLKFLKSFFERYLYAGTSEKLKAQLWKEGWEFYNEMKSFLNLYQYGDYTD